MYNNCINFQGGSTVSICLYQGQILNKLIEIQIEK